MLAVGERLSDRIGTPVDGESFTSYFGRTVRTAEVNELGRRVAGWISLAELRDLLHWRLPETGSWDQMPEGAVGSKVCESQWLADRFLLTYVEDWHTASLHELLKLGNHEQAVALFQGALAVAPNLWVQNCLAFCLVTSDPSGAALMFHELLDEGFDPALIHANLAATSRLQGDLAAAHAYAREGLELLSNGPPRRAFLWGFENDQPVLMDVDLDDYLRFVLAWGS